MLACPTVLWYIVVMANTTHISLRLPCFLVEAIDAEARCGFISRAKVIELRLRSVYSEGNSRAAHVEGGEIATGSAKNVPVLGAEAKAGDTPSISTAAKAKSESRARTGTANVPTGTKNTGERSGTSKCKHGWQNSFVCERNNGGCNQ